MFSRFEFNYSCGSCEEDVYEYMPSDLLRFVRSHDFESVDLDFGMGRWKEAVHAKVGESESVIYQDKEKQLETYEPGVIFHAKL